MRWFITKKHLVFLIGILVAALIYSLLSGCIPVTVRPQFDDKGKPIAIPVTPTGSISADGTINPIYEVSNESPKPTNWAAIGTGVSVVISALLAAYGINLRRVVGKAKGALKIACDLAEANGAAETDDDVKANKRIAESLQLAAGVHDLTQKVRGK